MSISTTFTRSEWTVDQARDAVRAGLSDPSVAPFHRHWYGAKTTWSMTRYRGVPTLKNPLDLHVYHEAVFWVRPALIIETGTAYGGATLHFRDCQSMAGVEPNVVTIDLEERTSPDAVVQWDTVPGVTRLIGSSTDPEIVATVTRMSAQADGPVMLSLDSDHSADHVFAELCAYAPLVTVGSFAVVEDTNLSDPLGIDGDDGGPAAAVARWRSEHPEYQPDPMCERYLLTMHPGGWLRRES